MNRFPFALIVMGLVALSTGCTLGEIYGDKCPEWVAVYQDGVRIEYEESSPEALEARQSGYCPENYICSLDSDKQRICRTKCDENSFLCNEKCMTSDKYQFSFTKYEGLDYCVAVASSECSEKCANGCDESGKCLCSDQCPNHCNSNGECICLDGDAVCTGPNAIKECSENKWEEKNCPAGCQKGSAEKRDTCISFVCEEDQVQCNPEDNHKVLVCHNNAWQDNNKDCQFGCDNGECLSSESILVSLESVWLLNNDDPSNNSKSINAKYVVNTVVTASDLDINASDINCVLVVKNPLDDHSTQLTLSVNPEVKDSCSTSLTLRAGKATKKVDVRVFAADEDSNGNYMLDYFETASKQGLECRKYSDCDSSDGKEKGFCDSFIGYHCSTRCTEDMQCIPAKNIDGNKYSFKCRHYEDGTGDGRCAPDTFETLWEIPDGADSRMITLPTVHAMHCNFELDWGDGSSIHYSSCPDNNLTHEYAKSGTYRVRITGSYDNWAFSNTKDYKPNPVCDHFKGVVSFGPVGLAGKGYYVFYKCVNHDIDTQAVDIPDSSKLTNMAYMFKGNPLFNQPIGNWDTSNVTNLSHFFEDAKAFNQPIGNWMTSKVTTLNYAFSGAKAFNQDLDGWDTSNVTKMQNVFSGAIDFNGKLETWDTSNVESMAHMFHGASSFNQVINSNQALNRWITSNVTDMSEMFLAAKSFNQKLDKWDVSNVGDMESMFSGAIEFDQDINNWDVSKVTNMAHMFHGATNFNQPLNKWNTSSLTYMSSIFANTNAFNQDLDNWNVSNVSSMNGVFERANAFNGNISTWNTSKVSNMEHMFYMASSFNQPINEWDTSKVKFMTYMFYYAKAFNQDLNQWNVGNVTYMANMFDGASAFNGDISTWDTSKVGNMEHMFYNASSFNQPINDWDTSNVMDMSWIFENAKSFNQPLDKWNISKASDLKNFFLGSGISKENYCILFKGLYASYWEKYSNSYLGVSYTCP